MRAPLTHLCWGKSPCKCVILSNDSMKSVSSSMLCACTYINPFYMSSERLVHPHMPYIYRRTQTKGWYPIQSNKTRGVGQSSLQQWLMWVLRGERKPRKSNKSWKGFPRSVFCALFCCRYDAQKSSEQIDWWESKHRA